MKKLEQYMNEVLGAEMFTEPIPKSELGKLPMYIGETFRLYRSTLFNHEFILAQNKAEDDFSILQIEKQFNLLDNAFGKKVVLLADKQTAYNRKRLIEKGINFIVPGKQLFLPDLLIDLRERFQNPKSKRKEEKLLPSAQFILLYHILHSKIGFKIDTRPFKELAEKFGYTQMAITKAVENLKYHELCKVEGTKEKFIHFNEPVTELWYSAEPLLVNPVLKTVFIDEIPKDAFMMRCNASALPEYSDMNPSRQQYYAIDKTTFYGLEKNKQLKNINEYEGNYCLEVWKYNPEKLAEDITEESNVDPLSLYLSLKDSHNERVEMALENIVTKNIY